MIGINETQLLLSERSKDTVIDGLKKLRLGILILTIISLSAWILDIVVSLRQSPPPELADNEATSILITQAVMVYLVTIISCLLSLAALFMFVFPGVSRLANWNNVFSTPSKLIKIGRGIGTTLLLIASIAIASGLSTQNLGTVLIGLLIAMIATILMFIGGIGLLLLLFRLREVFNVSILKTAGIILILNIVLDLFNLYASVPMKILSVILIFTTGVLIFIGLGTAISRLKQEQP